MINNQKAPKFLETGRGAVSNGQIEPIFGLQASFFCSKKDMLKYLQIRGKNCPSSEIFTAFENFLYLLCKKLQPNEKFYTRGV